MITPYRNINREDLKKLVNKVFSKPSVTREIVLYTGAEGKWAFDWILLFGDMLEDKYYRHNFKRVKIFYFSLFKKSGEYKLKVSNSTFEFFKGTVLIHTIKNVTNLWVSNSGDINSKETKLKIKEVNDYIKYLEKL